MKNFYKILSFLAGVFLFTAVTYAYSDVSKDAPHFEAIDYVSSLGIAKGYSDNAFHPKNILTRAEFIKMVVIAKFGKNVLPEITDECFTDVSKDAWFFPYICYAKEQKIVSGYLDASFKPLNQITMAEAAKIVVQTLMETADVSSGKFWYSVFIETLAKNNYIPLSVQYINQPLKREEIAEILWRILNDIHNEPSSIASEIEDSFCQTTVENILANINMDKVRTTWLTWYNDARKEEGLHPYIYNVQLNRTATVWSEYSKNQGKMSHKRPGQTAYYDYTMIKAWFKNLGLEFENIAHKTFTENIGWGYYSCPSSSDCTDAIIKAIYTTFDFFMSEKDKKYRAHYESVMDQYFKEIGLGIALNATAKKYYLTVHYGTEIISSTPPICP